VLACIIDIGQRYSRDDWSQRPLESTRWRREVLRRFGRTITKQEAKAMGNMKECSTVVANRCLERFLAPATFCFPKRNHLQAGTAQRRAAANQRPQPESSPAAMHEGMRPCPTRPFLAGCSSRRESLRLARELEASSTISNPLQRRNRKCYSH